MNIFVLSLLHPLLPCGNLGAIVVMIEWQLDLQLPMQSIPITIKIVILNTAHGEVYLIYLCKKVCQ
jgi:hypothetical protein